MASSAQLPGSSGHSSSAQLLRQCFRSQPRRRDCQTGRRHLDISAARHDQVFRNESIGADIGRGRSSGIPDAACAGAYGLAQATSASARFRERVSTLLCASRARKRLNAIAPCVTPRALVDGVSIQLISGNPKNIDQL
eukprot:4729124-Pyramimonas_sp.AAC.1